mmetsp:Transcript_34692/g.98304  ORF Transcript_34692/g.98304 Transcript_34692/m.98304 type:complete len:424 (+) Transcript_34692:163-1434(+)|eukprot:CAMPEP_0117651874 /NCGR_PEP_ID=MMETSP0804-20121206/2326_1 /TAXON_ID=1074897 /ORGANISM="Tetraselmis astigmatica, Strain CCMP880" /LENGTH=423 /DNA_ID=CAMNT_0005457883 /DNA_START=80 /DNA_END=1351 /DNA_ORIENTATION=-
MAFEWQKPFLLALISLSVAASAFEELLTFPIKPPSNPTALIVANLAEGNGDLCDSTGWRGDLPRYLSNYILTAEMLVWENARENSAAHCYICTPQGRLDPDNTFDCDDWFEQEGRTADALIMIGSGPTMCKDPNWGCEPVDHLNPNKDMKYNHTAMYNVVKKPWRTADTWTVHIPVSTSDELNENVYHFSRVVQDTEFIKPPAVENIEVFGGSGVNSCATTPKQNVLIFPGLYSESDEKGQVAFLRAINGEDLQGYSIRFFGSGLTDTIANRIRAIAKVKGISVSVDGLVDQSWLMHQMCVAKGVVSFSKFDSNPRVVYEGLPAGNPVYISSETKIPITIHRQGFIFSDSHDHAVAKTLPDGMVGFRFFMHAVRAADPQYHRAISEIAHIIMDHHAIYFRVCKLMLLCQPGQKTYKVALDDMY